MCAWKKTNGTHSARQERKCGFYCLKAKEEHKQICAGRRCSWYKHDSIVILRYSGLQNTLSHTLFYCFNSVIVSKSHSEECMQWLAAERIIQIVYFTRSADIFWLEKLVLDSSSRYLESIAFGDVSTFSQQMVIADHSPSHCVYYATESVAEQQLSTHVPTGNIKIIQLAKEMTKLIQRMKLVTDSAKRQWWIYIHPISQPRCRAPIPSPKPRNTTCDWCSTLIICP